MVVAKGLARSPVSCTKLSGQILAPHMVVRLGVVVQGCHSGFGHTCRCSQLVARFACVLVHRTLTTHSSGRRSIACASSKLYGAGAAKFRR